ncbi:MAG: helix-turn-helix transcriptional regulator [Paenibacillaceae bacterium]
MSILGERLKKLREDRGWSQVYVAQQLRIKRSSTYANWEYGIRNPDIEILVKLASIFRVTTDYLTGASDTVKIPDADELDLKIIKEVQGLSKDDKEYVFGFIRKIKSKK